MPVMLCYVSNICIIATNEKHNIKSQVVIFVIAYIMYTYILYLKRNTTTILKKETTFIYISDMAMQNFSIHWSTFSREKREMVLCIIIFLFSMGLSYDFKDLMWRIFRYSKKYSKMVLTFSCSKTTDSVTCTIYYVSSILHLQTFFFIFTRHCEVTFFSWKFIVLQHNKIHLIYKNYICC